MYFFQCIGYGEKGKTVPMSNEMSGDFCVIDKEKADVVLSLKMGDKIRLTGKTFTQNYFGTEVNTFLIVEKVKKLTYKNNYAQQLGFHWARRANNETRVERNRLPAVNTMELS
jgi:hypothetical protein